MDIGDKLEVVVIYHDKPNSGKPHPTRPGVVRAKDGKLYVLDLIETK